MFLKRVKIDKYKVLENIDINLEENGFPSVFSIASVNGGGKSTLLQFIFILLSSFNDEKRKVYIQNLLEDIPSVEPDTQLAKFVINHEGKDYDLEFILSFSKDLNDSEDIKVLIDEANEQYPRLVKEAESSFQFKNKPNEKDDLAKQEIDIVTNIESSIFDKVNKEELKELSSILKEQPKEKTYKYLKDEDNFKTPSSIINLQNNQGLLSNSAGLITARPSIYEDMFRPSKESIERAKKESDKVVDARSIYINKLFETYSLKDMEFNNSMSLKKTTFITSLKNTKNILLLKSNMSQDLLNKLSESIYLTAPSSQIFLFLPKEQRIEVFNNSSTNNYSKFLIKAKEKLSGFLTYDFSSTELILKSLQKAINEDNKIMRKTGKYGCNYISSKKKLKNFLGKDVTEDEEGKRVIFKKIGSNQELLPENLSHGELKKLGIYIWLNYLVEKDSIILFDEIDIALHPKWQYQIVEELNTWSKSSQFFLATHSPQILSSTHYKNIIKLKNGGSIQFSTPPVDRDINSIIVEYMESKDFPEELRKLHKKYRNLIVHGKIDTKEAKELKKEILEYESENSSFFQDINFDLELL